MTEQSAQYETEQAVQPLHEQPLARQSHTGAVTPDQMLKIAVERGADVTQLEKLMDLHERWENREAEKAFVQAMNAFRADPPRLTKNHRVDYTTNKGRTQYDHATLDHVCEVIGCALANVGISYRWQTTQVESGAVQVTCILTHRDGHSEKTALQAMPDQSGGKNAIQAVGSVVTYLERYTLLAATGMAAEDQDDDGRIGGAAQQGATQGQGQTQGGTGNNRVTPAQIQSLLATAKKCGYSEADIKKMGGVKDLGQLSEDRYGKAMDWLKNNARVNQ